MDRSGVHEPEHDRTEHDPVADEQVHRVRHEVPQKESDRGVSDNEREASRYSGRSNARSVLPSDVTKLEEPTEHHCRHGEKERVAGGRSSLQAEKEPCAERGPGA